jgi:hypothetical protein
LRFERFESLPIRVVANNHQNPTLPRPPEEGHSVVLLQIQVVAQRYGRNDLTVPANADGSIGARMRPRHTYFLEILENLHEARIMLSFGSEGQAAKANDR